MKPNSLIALELVKDNLVQFAPFNGIMMLAEVLIKKFKPADIGDIYQK